MSKNDLHIWWATHQAAKYACEHWHYSKKIPVFKSVKMGVWEHSVFKGVVIFSQGATINLGKPYCLKNIEVCELSRVALDKHNSPVSRIVAISIRFLKRMSPNLKLIVSFADEKQDHIGIIYQAGNWYYTGASISHEYCVNGLIVHPKSLHSKYGKGGQSISWLRENVDSDAKRIHCKPKHRYLMPLDNETHDKIAHLIQPYPKRPKQATADVQSERRRCDTDPDAPYSEGHCHG